jgi:hypothetical protein
MLGKRVTQGQISRAFGKVTAWIKAGKVLPDLAATPPPKAAPMDPDTLDMGKRRDGRTKRQRERRNDA